MISIKKVKNSMVIRFDFVVVDEDNKENQIFGRMPKTVVFPTNNMSAKAMNKQAVRVLRETIDSSLKDLEYCVEYQRNPNYFLKLQNEPKAKFKYTNMNKW